MPVFLTMMLLGSLLLKPLHELTAHHCEKNTLNHDKTEVAKKIPDCPICDLQAYLFVSDFKTYTFKEPVLLFHTATYGITEGFYSKIFDKKRGRAPPKFTEYQS